MSIAEPIVQVAAKPKRRGRPWNKAVMMLLRRGHLYLGLLSVPLGGALRCDGVSVQSSNRVQRSTHGHVWHGFRHRHGDGNLADTHGTSIGRD